MRILDPDLLIRDSHHHLVNDESHRYTIEDLRADVALGHRVVGTIYVEWTPGREAAAPADGGAADVAVTASIIDTDPDGLVEAIVGYADLAGENLTEVLEAHIGAGKGRFRGVRNMTAWDPEFDLGAPPGRLLEPQFRRGLALLSGMELTFDAFLLSSQLAELLEVARELDGLTIVLNHFGGPVRMPRHALDASEMRAEWRARMSELAACPNVFVKLGGIGMSLYGASYQTDGVRPFDEVIADVWSDDIRSVIDTFGPDRCMFESNFPADRGLCDYATLWNAFKLMTAEYSVSERADLFANSAGRAYSLGNAEDRR